MTKKQKNGLGAGIIGAGFLSGFIWIAGASEIDRAQETPVVAVVSQAVETSTQKNDEMVQTDPTDIVKPIEGEDSLHPVNPDNGENGESQGLSVTPTIEPTEAQEETVEIIPIGTVTPIFTPTVELTKEPSKAPTISLIVTPTIEPTRAVTVTVTVTPMSTPKPTLTPTPASTNTPTPSRMPTATPKAGKTPTNTITPIPTKAVTQTPTQTPTKAPTKPPTPVPTMPPEERDPHEGMHWGHQERLVRRTDIEAILFRKVNELRVANGLPKAEDPYNFDARSLDNGALYADTLLRMGKEIASRNAKEHRADHYPNQIGVQRSPFNGTDSAEYIAQYLFDKWCGSPNHYYNLLADATLDGEVPNQVQLFQFVVYDYCEFEGYDDETGDHWANLHSVAAICGFATAMEEQRIKK